MMEHTVSGKNEPTFFGLTGIESIKQNIKVICSTYAGSVPLDRAMGIDASLIDKPGPLAKTLLASNIIEAVEKYEPRARVTSVTFKDTDYENSSTIEPIIKFIERKEGE